MIPYRYLLLKNNSPARIYCECISLSLLFNVYFTLNLPGRVLNKQIWISYGIFLSLYVICGLTVGRPVTDRLELLLPREHFKLWLPLWLKEPSVSGHHIGHSRLSGKSRGYSGGSIFQWHALWGQSGSSTISLTVWAGGPAVFSVVGGSESSQLRSLRLAANGRYPAACASRCGSPALAGAIVPWGQW